MGSLIIQRNIQLIQPDRELSCLLSLTGVASALCAWRVRYSVSSQADFAHSRSNALPVFNTP